MKTTVPQTKKARGFTLVEMLTTMAIAAILIGLLVPAFGLIRNAAMMVRQKSQLHGIEVSLEAFRSDFGDYPPSNYHVPGTINNATDSCGAQKLAEALVGWDGFGVHPLTAFRGDGTNDVDGDGLPELIYDVNQGIYGTNTAVPQPVQTAADNRRVRKGPYLELESANAVKLSDIYGANLPGSGATILADSYVLADQFGKVTNTRTRKKTGMPILYFKANPTGTLHETPNPINVNTVVYNVRNNMPLFSARAPFAANLQHPLSQNAMTGFYAPTTNPNYAPPPPRPYRSESYILLSAGPDGLYGTADDVFNFDTDRP